MAVTDPNILQQYPNNPGIESQIDQAMIAQTTPSGYQQANPYSQQVVDAYNAQFTPKETGELGPNALYPGAGFDVNVGTYGGKVIGSNPIFVPGGNIMAIDPVLARRKALDDAARLRASSIKPFTYKEPFRLKDQRFQQSLSDQTEKFATDRIREAQAKYGKDFGVVLSDQSTPEGREFLQGMANYETLGRNFDQVTDLMAAIEQGLQDKTKTYSPETLKLYNDFKTLAGNFANGDVEAGVDLADMYDKLKGARSFEDYIQTDGFLKDFQGRINQSFYVNEAGDYFRTGTTKKVEYGDAINEVVDSLADRDFAPEIQSGIYTKDYLKRAIRARLKDQKISDGSISQKTEATRGAEQIEEIPDPNTSINFYQKDKLGSADIYDYDQFGNRKGRISLGALAEAQMRIIGSEKSIYERTPDGDLKQTKFKGIPLSNIQVVTGKGKSTDIPGNVYAELGEVMKLEDGTIVQKARYTRPTKVKTPVDIASGEKGDRYEEDGKPKYRSYKTSDAFTFEDGYIVLEQKGQPTGAKTEIKNKIQSKEARERYDESVTKVKEWDGSPKSSKSHGKGMYEYQGETWSYDELKGNGWTDEQIKSLSTK